MSFIKILSNNLFMIKIITKGSKWLLPINVAFQMFWAVADFVFYTLFLRYIINCITNSGNVAMLITTLIVWTIFQTLVHILANYYYETHGIYQNNRVYEYVRKLVYKQSSNVDLSCYENPEYFNKLTKAVSECDERITAVISSVTQLSYRMVTSKSTNLLPGLVASFCFDSSDNYSPKSQRKQIGSRKNTYHQRSESSKRLFTKGVLSCGLC